RAAPTRHGSFAHILRQSRSQNPPRGELRARHRITLIFGASAEGPDAKRRDAGDASAHLAKNVVERFQLTIQPSASRMIRWPYAALVSECVTCTIVVPF